MSRRTTRLLGALAALAIAATLGVLLAVRSGERAAAEAAQGAQPAPGPGRLVGATRAGERVDFTLTLRMPGHAALERRLREVGDPSSPEFRHYLAPAAFGARYGLSKSAIAALRRRLAASGVEVTHGYPQRTALEAHASVARLRALFGVRMGEYVDARGRRWHAPLGATAIPRSLSGLITGVAGLDTRPLEPQAVPAGGLKPADAARAYDLLPLYREGIRGQGQTIAIVSYSDYPGSDLTAYRQRFRIGGPSPQRVPIQGGVNTDVNADEAALDVEMVKGIAPDANVLVYEPPEALPLKIGPVISRIVADHKADIVSISYGLCELQYAPSDVRNDEQAIEAAALTGVSIFVATGDDGAYMCQQIDPRDHRLAVPWPAASPAVIAVGGTRVVLRADGSYGKEQGWEDVLSASGGGGGLSSVEPRPPWQNARTLGVINRFSNGHRQIPDVSADADTDTGWSSYYGGSPQTFGGTSAAAPFWAASVALMRQYAAGQGVRKLGFLSPSLYHLASTPQPFPPFHDVTEGGNRYYQATRGWDYATGLGTPDVWNLTRDLTEYLKSRGR